ncbi:MAG: DUF2085 domain-containing protein [Anaerolineae bacterium]|nr:DUF2085 domain-containing protein [Anaerolineae bacterium]
MASPRRLFSARVAVGILLLLALGLALAPGSLLDKMRALGFGLDPQRPLHSFFLAGEPMPIEARKVGIYGGFGLAAGWLAWRRSRATRLQSAAVYAVALAGIAIMAADGTNALFFDLGLPHLYAPRLDLRVLTGLAAGLGMATLLWPVWAQAAWRSPQGLIGLRDLAAPAGLGIVTIVGLIGGQAWLMIPVSLVATGGLVTVVALLNGVLLLVALRREATADGWRDLLDVATLALVMAVLELLALATLRYALIGTTPLP